MAKFKFNLSRLPDFKLPVSFTMPNGVDAEIVFTVKHRSTTEMQELYGKADMLKDIDYIKEIVSGWDLDEEFNDENVLQLIQLFPGVVLKVSAAYMSALVGQRVKN